MDTNLIQMLVRNTEQLPVLPRVAQKILNMADSRLCGAKELADVVMLEPALAAKILQVANSSLYNLRSEVTTLADAVSLLGFDVVRNMVLSISVLEGLKAHSKGPALDRDGLWEHCLACAILSRSLMKQVLRKVQSQADEPGQAPKITIEQPASQICEEAFMGGLFHDIGKILMHKFFPREYWEVIQRAALNEENLWDLERELIGLAHTELGDWLAQHWKLPNIFRWCIRQHHLIPRDEVMPAGSSGLMAVVIMLSDFFVRLLDIGSSANPWIQVPPADVWDMVALDEENYKEMLIPLREQVNEVKQSFGIGRTSASAEAQMHSLLDPIKQHRFFLAAAGSRRINPLAIALDAMGLPWADVGFGQDLPDGPATLPPDYVLIDLSGQQLEAEALRSWLETLRRQTRGPILLFGSGDGSRPRENLSEKKGILGFTMFPSRNRLIKELSYALALRNDCPADGDYRTAEPGCSDTGQAKDTIDFDMGDCSHTEEIPSLTQSGTVLNEMWSRPLRHRSNYLQLEPIVSGQQMTTGNCIGDKYQILDHLCRGGMADIYRVKSVESSQEYALKFLPLQAVRDTRALKRFWQEAAKISTLKHPNVIRIVDHSEDFANHYFVMELATGWKTPQGDIALDVEKLPKPLDGSTAMAIIRHACDGLEYIHQQGFIHRDMKPANLLLFDNGCVKISDFGIAKTWESSSLTVTGMLVGTPEYVSPEQIEGEKNLTPASDIYSLGVVMYEMLTGISPFKRRTSLATIAAHIGEPAVIPSELEFPISDGIRKIVLKCLKKTADQRFASVAELRQEIEAQLEVQAPA